MPGFGVTPPPIGARLAPAPTASPGRGITEHLFYPLHIDASHIIKWLRNKDALRIYLNSNNRFGINYIYLLQKILKISTNYIYLLQKISKISTNYIYLLQKDFKKINKLYLLASKDF
jgi:hypothetical protein